MHMLDVGCVYIPSWRASIFIPAHQGPAAATATQMRR